MTVKRIPLESMRYKSKVTFYHLPGEGGFMWAVATARDTTVGFREQAAGALAVIDGYLRDAGLDRTRVVRAEVIVADHDRKPEFDKIWSEWMPIDNGPVRSFVQSVMPEGDEIENIVTLALPHDYRCPDASLGLQAETRSASTGHMRGTVARWIGKSRHLGFAGDRLGEQRVAQLMVRTRQPRTSLNEFCKKYVKLPID